MLNYKKIFKPSVYDPEVRSEAELYKTWSNAPDNMRRKKAYAIAEERLLEYAKKNKGKISFSIRFFGVLARKRFIDLLKMNGKEYDEFEGILIGLRVPKTEIKKLVRARVESAEIANPELIWRQLEKEYIQEETNKYYEAMKAKGYKEHTAIKIGDMVIVQEFLEEMDVIVDNERVTIQRYLVRDPKKPGNKIFCYELSGIVYSDNNENIDEDLRQKIKENIEKYHADPDSYEFI